MSTKTKLQLRSFCLALAMANALGCDSDSTSRLGTVVAQIKNPELSNVLVPALVLHAGQPLVIYYDDSDAGLYAAYSLGETWQIELIESGSSEAAASSLYLAAATDEAGNVHAAYRDASAANIRYINGVPGSWEAIEPLPAGEDRGAGLDIAVDLGGNPWIAYRNDSTKGLEVAYRDDENWLIETVDNDGNTGFGPAIDHDLGGRMLVGYHNGSDRSAKMAEFKSAGDWTISSIEAPEIGIAGRWLSLAVRAGESQDLALTFPRFAYLFEQDATMTLHFAQPDEAGGWAISEVEPLLFGGSDNCMAVAGNGQVWLSYLDAASLDLKVARLVDKRWRVAVVDSAGAAGFWSDCLLDIEGRFHIAYVARDETSAQIRYQVLDAGF